MGRLATERLPPQSGLAVDLLVPRWRWLASTAAASPRPATAVAIILEILGRCFCEEMAGTEWQTRLKEMIPSFGQSLIEDATLHREIQTRTSEAFELRKDKTLATT